MFISIFFEEHQHNRLNPLTGQWVLVSPHRLLRPWSGQEETPQIDEIPEFDPKNPLCPGVTRSNGQVIHLLIVTHTHTDFIYFCYIRR